ncbi:MAG: alpha/beta fold hydrolase [Halieaceae bacterium]|nr:alpha/beta fold hydrolase [Halieaceae bacterium]
MLLVILLLALLYALSTTAPDPELWHEVVLEEEFNRKRHADIASFADYLALEERLFAEVREKVYTRTPRGELHQLERYSAGSAADPARWETDWNRSFELRAKAPRGAVLLLHGMSDSPYSLSAIGRALHANGYDVLGLRYPGHGTIPSGLLEVHWTDMTVAARLAMMHLGSRHTDTPIHIMGYSTGAPIALLYALEQLNDPSLPPPASLVMLSPAIAISPAAALAQWNHKLSYLPGLGGLAWLDIQPEFDPFKYKSFATNAAEQVHLLTREVANGLAARPAAELAQLPPMLVLKSAVDSTTSTSAVVDGLLTYLAPGRHEYLLFDINRRGANASILVNDPGPITERLLQDDSLPFTVTIVGNRDRESIEVVARTKPPMSADTNSEVELGKRWPQGMLSLSHIALPFPPEDPLYGAERPARRDHIFLGTMAIQGESHLLRVSSDWLLRARHNPFYDYMLERISAWLENAEQPAQR